MLENCLAFLTQRCGRQTTPFLLPCSLPSSKKYSYFCYVLVESRLFLSAALYKQLTTLLSFSLKIKFRHYMFSTYTAGGALLEVLTAFTEQCTDITPISFQLKHNISKFFHKRWHFKSSSKLCNIKVTWKNKCRKTESHPTWLHSKPTNSCMQ